MDLVRFWQNREQARFADGTYKPIPVLPVLPVLAECAIAIDPEHYLHLSVTQTETDTVAFTANAAHGEQDRQTRMKFGRYLKRFFPALTDCQVQKCVVALRAAIQYEEKAASACLQFATDRETLNEIFETKMSPCDSTAVSCMYGKFEDWTDRPYHVYADSPEVALAYVREDGQIVSRSVVSTKDKIYVRLYARGGEECRCSLLRSLLEAAGYSHGALTGSRLTKLARRKGQEVLPYIDNGGQNVTKTGNYWTVAGDGEWAANQTEGYATDNDADRCECCESRSQHGCDSCFMCPQCDGCIDHDGCRCERCAECGELDANCECERCEDCEKLSSECECEPAETETPIESTTV